MIEQKGMRFDHDFGYSFLLFSSVLKKREEEKDRMNSKNRDQKSCCSARSRAYITKYILIYNIQSFIYDIKSKKAKFESFKNSKHMSLSYQSVICAKSIEMSNY